MRWFLLFFLLLSFCTYGQGKRKPKNSYARGTLFAHWGYNTAFFGKSTIDFVGPGYEFSLAGVKAIDDASRINDNLNLTQPSIPLTQFNARLGYYIRNNFAISFGIDHMSYLMDNGNQILLAGSIDPGMDTVNNWSGDYTNEQVTSDRSKFYYDNSGLNYLRLEATRTDRWIALGKNDLFALSTNMGIGLGGLHTKSDLFFGGRQNFGVRSFSGFGVSGHLGVRLELFRHVYFQGSASGGYLKQLHVHTSEMDANAYAKNGFGYSSLEAVVGVLLYIRPTNDCNSCPHW